MGMRREDIMANGTLDGAALIIVDVQNDFCPGGALAVADGDQVVPVINRLVSRFAVVATTQDWHPADHCSFAEEPKFVDKSWPKHCVAETPGAELHEALVLPDTRLSVQKGTDAGVEAYSGFQGTGLAEMLKEQNVKKVYVCGLATDYCVKATALDALESGFETSVVLDGCRGVNVPEGSVDDAIKALREAGVDTISSDQVQ